jgi:hypothetical protein
MDVPQSSVAMSWRSKTRIRPTKISHIASMYLRVYIVFAQQRKPRVLYRFECAVPQKFKQCAVAS